MTKFLFSLVLTLLLLMLAGAGLRAGQNPVPHRELSTVASAVEVVQALSAIPLKCIPPSLMGDAKGVAIFPHVVKAGLVIDKRFGRGVLSVRQPDGSWSDPVFVTVDGGGIGLQAGVESTDLVLVFKSGRSLDRILKGKGKLTLGGDLSVAAGPIGREAEAATDGRFMADVFTYSRAAAFLPACRWRRPESGSTPKAMKRFTVSVAAARKTC